MGFCTNEEYQEFLRSCPEFERMLVRSGILFIKYWFSVSDEEQERRFQETHSRPDQTLEAQSMDLESRKRWVEYSKAKDDMFAHTDIKPGAWYVINSENKKRARLNCITHLLSMVTYKTLTPEPIECPSAKVIRPTCGHRSQIKRSYPKSISSSRTNTNASSSSSEGKSSSSFFENRKSRHRDLEHAAPALDHLELGLSVVLYPLPRTEGFRL